MVIKVPTLSANGWLTEMSERADTLMTYYLTTEYSQSYIYDGNVTSLPYHIQSYDYKDLSKLENTVKESLALYFNRYFDSSDVICKAVIDPLTPNEVNLNIEVIVYEGQYKYSIGREILIANNKVVKIFDITNNG